MKSFFEITFESLRMLSFLTLLGLTTLAVAPLTGCDNKTDTSVPTSDTDKDISINAPGVNVDIDRTPNADGSRDIDVNVNPGAGPGVDIDVDRTPVNGPAVDVDVDNN